MKMSTALRELAKGIISEDDLDKIEKIVKTKSGNVLTDKDIEQISPFFLQSRLRWAFQWDKEKAAKITVLIYSILFNNGSTGMQDNQLAWLNSYENKRIFRKICEEMKDTIKLNPEYFDEDFNCIYHRKLIQNILKRMAKTAEDINKKGRANFITAIAVPSNIGEKETSLKLEIYLRNINGKEIKDYLKNIITRKLTSQNRFFKVKVYDENCIEAHSDETDSLNMKFIYKKEISPKGFMYAFVLDKKHRSICFKAESKSVSTEDKNPDEWYVVLQDFEYDGETVKDIKIRKNDIGKEFSFKSFSVRFYNTKEGITSAFRQSLDRI